MNSFGEFLYSLRKEKGMTQATRPPLFFCQIINSVGRIHFNHLTYYDKKVKIFTKGTKRLMMTCRKWNIKINKQSYCTSVIDGELKYFFIGLDNGLQERSEELYFSQREKDKEKYIISFDPVPYFISYSFFYGLFNETITKMCYELDNSNSILAQKSIITNKFFDKYGFEVNDKVNAQIREYVAAIIEKNFDIQGSSGVKNGFN